MYIEVFKEIVTIMHEDYAGCLDKKGWDNPKKHLEELKSLEDKGGLSSVKFVEVVQDYLLDFQDKHIHFGAITQNEEKEFDNGFKVRRYEDKLYITSTGQEKRLKQGDTLISLDNTPILELVKQHKRSLMEVEAERENWRKIISNSTYCEVIDTDGNKQTLKLKEYEKEKYIPEYSVKKFNHNTLYMTLTDFGDPDAIVKLVKESESGLNQISNLIIDVRINYGGSDGAFHELLPYLFLEKPTLLDLSKDYAMKFNCTERNHLLQLRQMNNDLKEIEDEQTRKMLYDIIDLWEENKGKGFVYFDKLTSSMPIVGKEFPKNIIVLSDVTCGSAGDIFVDVCKRSPKVTVVGRPTAGVNDYANLTKMEWEGLFELWYPTSRLDIVEKRSGMDPGIQPDIYIPWTPEHITEDIDLMRALQLLK